MAFVFSSTSASVYTFIAVTLQKEMKEKAKEGFESTKVKFFVMLTKIELMPQYALQI